MAEDIVNRIELESKHKKEKKELQAQIQALKKAAKNDKTKKKELTAEITRLESELEERHENEMESIGKVPKGIVIIPAQDVEIQEIITTSTKVSKAQKRRDKKQQQEKDREAQIKVQERENLMGPRHVELQVIHSKLKQKQLQIYAIPSDGDCLYNAIAHQLTGSRNKTVTIDELRTNVAAYIRQNKDDFLPFLSNPDTFEMLTNVEFDDYCDKIANTKTWGGQLEIRALSNYLKCPICVIQATGPDSIEQGSEFEGPPLVITYHRHMYSLGEHFNSTQLMKDNEDN